MEIGNQRIYTAKCLCPNTELQFYDGNKCIGVIGGPCEPGSGNGCPKNAYCDIRQYDNDGVCKCQDGFVEYDEKNCDVAHGNVCEPKRGWSLHLYI